MRPLMVDTSAYSAFMRGERSAVDAVRHAPRLLMPATVLGELHAGFECGTRPEVNRQQLAAWLSSRRVDTVSTGHDTARRYGLIYADLRRRGQPMGANDLWIAASAMEHGAELLTCDSDFLFLSQVLVRHLPTPTT